MSWGAGRVIQRETKRGERGDDKTERGREKRGITFWSASSSFLTAKLMIVLVLMNLDGGEPPSSSRSFWTALGLCSCWSLRSNKGLKNESAMEMEARENYLGGPDVEMRDAVTNQMSKHAKYKVILHFFLLLFIHFWRLKTIKEG